MRFVLKKAVFAIITLLILLGVAACGGKTIIRPQSEQEAVDQYTAIKNNFLTNRRDAQYDLDFSVVYDMTLGTETQAITTTGNIKMKNVDGTVYYLYKADSGDFGGEVTMWSDGEAAYVESDGTTTEVFLSDLEEQVATAIDLPTFPPSYIDTFSSSDVTNGIEIEMIIDSEQMPDLIGDVMTEYQSLLGEDATFSTDDMVISYVVDESGVPQSMGMEFSFDITANGVSLSINAIAEIVMNKLGSGVTIELPDGTV